MEIAMADKERIPFNLTEPEFNTRDYMGRFRDFQKKCNPLYSFYTNSQIE
jgi:hypothetical protein